MALSTKEKDRILVVIIIAILLGLFLRAIFWVGLLTVLIGIAWLIVFGKTNEMHNRSRWWIGLVLIVAGIVLMRL